MSWQLRVGAVQMSAGNDLAANLATCKGLIDQAAAEGAQLVVLPECFAFLGRGEGDKLAIAESFSEDPDGARGPIAALLREQAAKHGLWIVGGGTPERIPGDAL